MYDFVDILHFKVFGYCHIAYSYLSQEIDAYFVALVITTLAFVATDIAVVFVFIGFVPVTSLLSLSSPSYHR